MTRNTLKVSWSRILLRKWALLIGIREVSRLHSQALDLAPHRLKMKTNMKSEIFTSSKTNQYMKESGTKSIM